MAESLNAGVTCVTCYLFVRLLSNKKIVVFLGFFLVSLLFNKKVFLVKLLFNKKFFSDVCLIKRYFQ